MCVCRKEENDTPAPGREARWRRGAKQSRITVRFVDAFRVDKGQHRGPRLGEYISYIKNPTLVSLVTLERLF